MAEWAWRALVLSGVGAVAVAQPRFAWLAVVAVVAAFVRVESLAARAARALATIAWILLLSAAAFGLVWLIYPAFPATVDELAPPAVGTLASLLASILLACRRFLPSPRVLLAAALACFAAAALDPVAPLGIPIGFGCAALVALARPELRALGAAVAALAASAALASATMRFLPWAQPLVEAAAVGNMSSASATTGLSPSTTSVLGSVESLAPSHTVLLRMWSREPRRLRLRSFDRFDGRAWSVGREDASTRLAPASADASVHAPALAAVSGTVYVLPDRSPAELHGPGTIDGRVRIARPAEVLFAPFDTVLLKAAIDAPFGSPDRSPFLPMAAAIPTYVFVATVFVATPGRAPAEPPDVRFLAIPPGTDPRLAALAGRLREGAAPEERVARTLAHLGRECRYSLSVGAFRSREPVAEFVFEKKRGYCEYFASAAALLLRIEGVPTRYVTGLNVTDEDFEAGHYVVRESDAHAWIDAWLPGRGWTEFDPTPPADYALVHENHAGPWATAWEWLRSEAEDMWEASARRAWGLLAALVVAGAAAAAARRALRAFGRRGPVASHDMPADLAALLATLDRAWRRAGQPRPASQGLLEHAHMVAANRPSPLADASRAVAERLYAARLGGRVLDAGEAAGLARRLKEARRQAG